MLLVIPFRDVCLISLLLATAFAAQRDCQGDESTYNQDGVVVTSKNLCGQDIQKNIDLFGATTEERWSDCLESCVKKVPLCYGFDYTPFVGYSDGKVSRNNCWLKNTSFSASDAIAQNFVVDAAMLGPDFVTGLSEDCKTLGLRGCFEQNNRTKSGNSSTRTPSTVMDQLPSTSTRTVPTIEPSITAATKDEATNLSTSAKAGIGAGAGVFVLMTVVLSALCALRCQKRRRNNLRFDTSSAMDLSSSEGEDPKTRLKWNELPAITVEANTHTTVHLSPDNQIHEIDGSARHEK